MRLCNLLNMVLSFFVSTCSWHINKIIVERPIAYYTALNHPKTTIQKVLYTTVDYWMVTW